MSHICNYMQPIWIIYGHIYHIYAWYKLHIGCIYLTYRSKSGAYMCIYRAYRSPIQLVYTLIQVIYVHNTSHIGLLYSFFIHIQALYVHNTGHISLLYSFLICRPCVPLQDVGHLRVLFLLFLFCTVNVSAQWQIIACCMNHPMTVWAIYPSLLANSYIKQQN